MLAWLFLSVAQGAIDECGTAPSTAPFTVTTDGGCAGADLRVEAVTSCATGCDDANVHLWISVANYGQSGSGPFDVVVSRTTGPASSPVLTVNSLTLATGAGVVLQELEVTEAQWGEGLVVTVDPRQFVEECNEANNVGSQGAWPIVSDADGDGYRAKTCGGLDCDDNQAAIHPGATEIAADSIDQNCDGDDALVCDKDGDGEIALGCGGTDCNDADAGVSTKAEDIQDDGIDQNCDGVDACADGPVQWVQGGLGCNTGGGPVSGALLLLLLPLLRRRVR